MALSFEQGTWGWTAAADVYKVHKQKQNPAPPAQRGWDRHVFVIKSTERCQLTGHDIPNISQLVNDHLLVVIYPSRRRHLSRQTSNRKERYSHS
jgi:hypothetical protein